MLDNNSNHNGHDAYGNKKQEIYNYNTHRKHKSISVSYT